MLASSNYLGTSRFADWPLAVKSILGFWFFYAVTVVARAFLGTDPLTAISNRLLTIGVGVGLTFIVYFAIASFARQGSIGRKTLVAGIASFIAACAMSAILITAQDKLRESREEFRYQAREGFIIIEKGKEVRIERAAAEPLVFTWPSIQQLDTNKRFRYAADNAIVWLFFFAAWSAYYLAAIAQGEALRAQRRAAEAEAMARSAQVRALRYQINPHFLFNTLNSLSSLVMSSRSNEAEEMILKLSTFFRSSLSLDPTDDVTLAEEIALQRLYLDIEMVRFPKRLKAEFDIPDELSNARLPGMILQPIVENSIKYGVSQTRDKVTLRIAAREAGPGRFTIEISNSGNIESGGKRGNAPDGVGVGLTNVCQRLTARFGPAAQCEFGPIAEGGYRVLLTLPLDRTDG